MTTSITTPRAGMSSLLRRMRKMPAGRVWAALPFTVLLLAALIGPEAVPLDPTRVAGPTSAPPSVQFWFGTDSNGLDVFSRVVAATRLDLFLSLAVTILATVAGVALGMFVGMFEATHARVSRFVARALSRALDLFQAIPVLVGGLVAVSFFGRNVVVITLALAAVLMPFQARLVRTEVLRVRSEAYIDAAHISGESNARIVWGHVLPNSASPALENMSAVFGMAIIFSAGLGFLGVGIPLPTPEWGSMLAIGAADAAVGRWWPAFFPALALCFSVWAASAFAAALFDRPR